MEKNTSSKPFFKRKGIRITYFVFLHAFAIAGAAIIGAWAIYKLGLTNNRGAIDQNNRYLAEIATIEIPTDSISISAADANRMIKMAALNKVFPFNGQIIWKATRYC